MNFYYLMVAMSFEYSGLMYTIGVNPKMDNAISVMRIIERYGDDYFAAMSIYNNNFIGIYLYMFVGGKSRFILINRVIASSSTISQGSRPHSYSDIDYKFVRSCLRFKYYSTVNGKIALCVKAVGMMSKLFDRVMSKGPNKIENVLWGYNNPMGEQIIRVQSVIGGGFIFIIPAFELSGYLYHHRSEPFIRKFEEAANFIAQ